MVRNCLSVLFVIGFGSIFNLTVTAYFQVNYYFILALHSQLFIDEPNRSIPRHWQRLILPFQLPAISTEQKVKMMWPILLYLFARDT